MSSIKIYSSNVGVKVEVDGKEQTSVLSAELKIDHGSRTLDLRHCAYGEMSVELNDVRVRHALDQPGQGINFLGDIQRLEFKPGDVFVVQCDQRIDRDVAESMSAYIGAKLGGATVLVLGDGLKLGCIAMPKAEPTPAAAGIARAMSKL